MAVPKKKHTKSRRDKRRANIFLKAPTLTACPKCRKPVLPHTACFNCGYYKGIEVMDVLKKLNRKEKKEKQKEITAKGEAEKTGKEKSLNWEDLSKK